MILPALVLPMAAQEDPAPQDTRPIMRFRMERLQESVGLNPEQAQRIVQRWVRFDQEHYDRQRQLAALRLRFEDILSGPGSETERSAKLKPLLDQFVDLRHQQMELRQKFEEDIRAQLNPAQQVRLILMVDEMGKRLQEAIRERRQERRGLR
jgi:hypothetical protein